MDSVSPQDIYARHLVSRRGYPLWTPEPSLTLPDVYRQQGLKIGDVGVVVPEDGSFDVFFNICLPPEHSLHRHTGVPNNFKHIALEDRDIAIFPEVESAGRIISTSSVTRIGMEPSNEDTTRPPQRSQPGPLNYEFILSSKEGALLILPEGAERYYLRNQRQFLEEAIQHAVDWYDFAEQRLGRIISHDALYLITGFYKARSWSLASYQHASGTGRVYAQFKALQVGGSNVSSSYSWETTHAIDWRVGPSDQYYNGIANQSVFIQGFKIAVRSSILGTKRVKVKAKPPVVRPQQIAAYTGSSRSNIGSRLLSSLFGIPSANNSRERDADSSANVPEGISDTGSIISDSSGDIDIQHVPQVLKPFHPSDIINQYLLRSHPSAAIAITHDTQWSFLLDSELIQPEEMAQEGRLEELAYNMLAVSQDGAVYLQNITPDDNLESNAASDEIVDVQETLTTLSIKECNALLEDPDKSSGQVDQDPPQSDAAETRPQEVPRSPVTNVQPHYSSEIRSSSSAGIPRSVFKKENTPTSSSFVPDTPKLRKISLPDGSSAGPSRPATRDNIRRPQTPVMLPSSREDSLPGKPTKPLKSILKGSKIQDPYKDKGEVLSGKKVATPSYKISNTLPPGARFVPMKQPAFDLHWQLLPFDPRRSRRLLRFDVAFPIDEIVFQDRGFRTKLSDAELDAPAANGIMTRMLIIFEYTPFSWDVDVTNAYGIRCRDVFQALYRTFNEPLTPGEQRLVRDRRAVEDAFRLRCRLARGLPEVELSHGWKRVDVLLHQTIFLGLTQPKSGGDWVLNLGALPHIPGLT